MNEANEAVGLSEELSNTLLLEAVSSSTEVLRDKGAPDKLARFLGPLFGILTLSSYPGVIARPQPKFGCHLAVRAVEVLTEDRAAAEGLFIGAAKEISGMLESGDEDRIVQLIDSDDPLKACAVCACIAFATLSRDGINGSMGHEITMAVSSIALSRACEFLGIDMMEHKGMIVFAEGASGAPVQ